MKYSSRKFIDLLLAHSSKWANWDPTSQIKVGDYGEVNKDTGQFEKEGNIYENADMLRITADYPPVTDSPSEIKMAIYSRTVKGRDVAFGNELNVPGLADASISGQWRFGKTRGALLVMARPCISHVPHKVLLKQLIDIPDLKYKSLITEVVSCPAYTLYMSNPTEHTISLALLGNAPLPDAPGVTGDGKTGETWWSLNTDGILQVACDPNGAYSYSPWYTLKKIRRQERLYRVSPVPDPEDDDLWVETQEPWDPLDEEGEEEEFEDTVFD